MTPFITSITDAVNISHSVSSLVYDGSSRLTSATSSAWSGNGVVGYTYDKLGNTTKQSLPWGEMDYNYDTTKNLLTGITGCNEYSFSYDAYGNVTSNGWFNFDYNDAGQMQLATGGGKNKQFAYDALGRRIKVTSTKDAVSKTEYEVYDDADRLLWLEEADGKTRNKKITDTLSNGNRCSYLPSK